MADVWTPLLANLPLSKTERDVARRFSAEPHGRSFLPVADILRAHRLVDESLELLTQGVERHPGFTVARVVLARELLAKGMINESWALLEQAPDSLRENVLAQKLRFKLALLLGHEATARACFQHLKLMQMLDPEVKRLGEILEVTGLKESRTKLHQELLARGTEMVLPPLPVVLPPPPMVRGDAAPYGVGAGVPPHAPGHAQGASTQGPGHGLPTMPPISGVPMPPLPGQAQSQIPLPGGGRPAPAWTHVQAPEISDEDAIASFHVVPLSEIFRPEGEGGTPAARGGGIELDSTTLAEIYARQGHYSKALEVYRRLLRVMPGSDLLRRKVAELGKMEREQKDVDLTVDPGLVDRMESVEIIDRQIKFYNDLLTRLS